MEIYKFYMLFRVKLKEYSTFIHFFDSCKKFSKPFIINNIENGESLLKFSDISEIFRTIDDKIGVTIKLNNRNSNLEIEDYKSMCSSKEKLKIEAYITSPEAKINNLKISMRLKLNEEKYKKMNKKDKKKFLEEIRYDEKLKEKNEYFLGLYSICRIFTIEKYRDIFKHISFSEKIERTNEILKEHNKILVQTNNENSIVRDFILKCKGPSIIILSLNDVDVFSFGIVNNEVCDFLEKEIEKYLNLKFFIKEYQIKDLWLKLKC